MAISEEGKARVCGDELRRDLTRPPLAWHYLHPLARVRRENILLTLTGP
jgi:hypothetical protein